MREPPSVSRRPLGRLFKDATGTEWAVWEVTRERLEEQQVRLDSLAPELRDGWLCFQSGAERRRRPNVPDGWLMLTDQQLDSLRLEAPIVGVLSTDFQSDG